MKEQVSLVIEDASSESEGLLEDPDSTEPDEMLENL